MKLQMKREALQKLNRTANESAGVLRQITSRKFWDGELGSETVFARKAKIAKG
jgi:hypothetical protein